jgi:mannose/fructose/N-acetylgalactosamine-specific phosphotransferase system component IIC
MKTLINKQVLGILLIGFVLAILTVPITGKSTFGVVGPVIILNNVLAGTAHYSIIKPHAMARNLMPRLPHR